MVEIIVNRTSGARHHELSSTIVPCGACPLEALSELFALGAWLTQVLLAAGTPEYAVAILARQMSRRRVMPRVPVSCGLQPIFCLACKAQAPTTQHLPPKLPTTKVLYDFGHPALNPHDNPSPYMRSP